MYRKKLARMHRPSTDFSKYENEKYTKNPLLKFHITDVHKRRHYAFLQHQAAAVKMKMSIQKHRTDQPATSTSTATPIPTSIFELPMLPDTTNYIDNLRREMQEVPIPKMHEKTCKQILSFAPNYLKNKYPHIVQLYMKELDVNYNRVMKIYSVKNILLHPEFSEEDAQSYQQLENQMSHKKQINFQLSDSNCWQRHQKYLAYKTRLTKRLLITHLPVRIVLNLSELHFPQLICDLEHIQQVTQQHAPHMRLGLNNVEALPHKTFVKLLTLQCDTAHTFIRWTWYPKLIQTIRKNFRRRGVPTKDWTRAFDCIEGLINRQINIMKQRTFDEMLVVVADPSRIPMLRLNFDYDEEMDYIDVTPSINEIYKIYTDVIDEIARVGTKMEPLHPQLDTSLTNFNREYLCVETNKNYLNEFKEHLKTAIMTTFEPIRQYALQLRDKYHYLYCQRSLDELDDFLSAAHKFDEYFRRIRHITEYIEMLRLEPMYDYFEMALISNERALQWMLDLADGLVYKIICEIIKEHIKAQEQICNEFEYIKNVAIKIPKSTEELLEISDFMTKVKKEKIAELRIAIESTLGVLTDLLELTELEPYHFELTIKTINWLQEINEICEQNSQQLELYKSIFEEHIQTVVKKLNDDLEEFVPKTNIVNDMSQPEKFRESYIVLQNFIDQLKIFDDYVEWINKEEKLFKMPVTQYPTLDMLKTFVYPFAELMKLVQCSQARIQKCITGAVQTIKQNITKKITKKLCISWQRYFNVWMDGPFEYLEPKFVEETTENFLKEFIKNQKYYRNKIKEDLIENPQCKFKGQTEDPDPEKHPVPLRLCSKMIQSIKDFSIGVFIVNIMCNPALRSRHWEEMSEIADFDMTPNAGTTLRKIMNYGLDKKLDQFEIISIGANKELQLQNNLHAMIKEWEHKEFPTGQYKETGIQILLSLDDIQALLDDHILKTLSMRGSAFMKPCQDEVLAWYDKITRVNATLERWSKVQANFLYLLPIFSSADIVAQMPEEGRLFTFVTQTFTSNMNLVLRKPNVMVTGPADGLLESLENSVELLDNITNGVNLYLEKKRLYFPRFYFLSNDEMLEILSETKDPLRVQPHLSKLFEGIDVLEFDEQKNVLAMFSGDKEKIEFVDQVSTAAAGGSVEKWFVGVESEMLKAVRDQMEKAFFHYPTLKRAKWVLHWPQMVVLCISQIYWAAQVHANLCKSFGSQAVMLEFFDEMTSELNELVTLIRSAEVNNLNRITIKSLIVIDVHAKDVIAELMRLKINNELDFNWMAQLRYYWENNNNWVRIINATVSYANEYLGNSDRLVITPLTDRCYRTLMGAYQLHLNGAPEGPAGTGKTETIKDLAKAIAVQCKVFNCSDGLDYKAMGKFFKGLATCGAWVCFDEFNRIDLEVLSVVAQQILQIIQDVRAKAIKFNFENTEVTLNAACYVCITMNPGYAGRSELPDNLKVLFRAVAMMVPDYAMIGEISLYSYGFVNARPLAVKIVTTYRLCSEQLSMQTHYDYGMRAVKSVLIACGNLKNQYALENEDVLLLRSLIDINLPKFLSFDVPLFEGIITDIFPGISYPKIDYSHIELEFKRICEEMTLAPTQRFLEKVIQTYEMMIVRHGFMLVGEPLAGKTKTLKVLAEILSALKMKAPTVCKYFQNIIMEIINPKSITMNQLYGSFDAVSYEWTDGLVARIFRDFAITKTEDRKWLIFDGPVDVVWIENMNTVLDDNKKLCLTSGEVITMTNEMSMIFEVMDLAQATPATISRCGMIYMETSTLGWRSFFDCWYKKCDKRWADAEHYDYMRNLFDWLLKPCQQFIRKHCVQYLYPGEFNCLTTTLDIFEMLLNEALTENPEDYDKFLQIHYQAAILYAFVWGIGGILDAASRVKFDNFLKEFWSSTETLPESLGKLDVSIPVDGILIDYVYIFKQRGVWKPWLDVVKRLEIEVTATGVQVPTVDTARYTQLLEMHIKHRKKLLLIGPTGTGKSAYIQNFLMHRLEKEQYESSFITFTVMITANQTQELLISKLSKRKRGIYGPPKGLTEIFFVDDMNMPIKETYGAQPPLELLRQFFDYNYVYDLKDSSKIYLKDVMFLSACGLIGGSRQNVYPRFLNHFNIFSINTFSDDTMNRIFVQVLLHGFKRVGHGNDVLAVTNQTVAATQQIYKAVQMELRATPAKSHYIFNLRDIARVINGCALIRKETATDKKIFARVWYHESLRVFADRLVDENDRMWIFEKLNDCIANNFHEKVEIIFENYFTKNVDVVEEQATNTFSLSVADNIFFGVYLDEDNLPDERRYEEISVAETFLKIATNGLNDYNSMRRTKIDITLFTFALQHLNRICRIISTPGASALLIGLDGSGRQSLTKLASHIIGTSYFQPEITKNYGPSDWYENLKQVLKEAGGYDKHTTFLMTENQLKMELFLQDIDCLLNQGEVPNIYAIDEKQEVLELVRLAAQGGNRNIDISPVKVFSYYVNRCKQKLHIVLCLSLIGNSLRTRVRLYPSLVNCCTIDWYQSWPEEALEMIAQISLETVNVPTDQIKQSIVETCRYFHTSANKIITDFCKTTSRFIYLTNASFLELINSFRTVITLKQNEIMHAKMRYIGGLETLANAETAISLMQKELQSLQPKLVEMAENCRRMMIEINKETVAASVAAEHVKRDEAVAAVQALAAQELKEDCEKDLAQAIPVLEDALQALNTLKPADITLVKSMKNPPSVIKLVMAAVCVIKGIPAERIPDASTGKMINDYWGPSKRLLGEMNFLQSLKDFDKDNINPDIIKKIRKEFIPHKDFQPSIVAKASSAAKGLCQWIIAMDLYDNVAKIVAPKKAKLAAAEKEYATTMAILNEKRELVAALERKVAALNKELEKANAELKHLQEEANFCQNKLTRAETLIGGLGGEKQRWSDAADGLQSIHDNLPGDILLSCGVIAYLAAVNLTFRSKCVFDWYNKCIEAEIPCSKEYNIIKALGNEVTIQNWNLSGLPNDIFSTENAIIANNSSRYSLFIDPQGQANNWLKNMEQKNRINTVKFTQKNYMKTIAEAIEFGIPIIIENILEELEITLDPILLRQTFVQNEQKFISLGDNIVPFSDNFRLYMTCNMRNPQFLPETYNKATIINFALTQNALEDQLLSIVVAKERPDLQVLRMDLINEAAKNKASLIDTENMILKTLSSAVDDILENESAIQILNDSKQLCLDIKAKQLASIETEQKMEAFRLNYKPVASHSSILYYSITDLPNIDPMYQFSLKWYIQLYMYSIESANKSKDLPRRIKFLVEGITKNLYNNVCRSLFEKDKLLFSFIMTTRILLGTGQLSMQHLSHLLTDAPNKQNADAPMNPDKTWITKTVWLNILRLEQLPEFKGFIDSFITNLTAWKFIYDHTEPEKQEYPTPWNDGITRFEKIIVLKALRPDKVFLAINYFIAHEMGEQFVKPPEFDIAKSYAESTALKPLIFILSPGADPLGALYAFAERMDFEESFQTISLGQGQGPIAQNIIKTAQELGFWICLQNCHLAASWMPQLEYLCENMDNYNTSANFRLWLTSYPTNTFPVALLQNGVKMTNEPPTGLKENIMRSYNSEPINDPIFYTGCPKQDRAFTRLLFGICFFHAVVQERRKYGPLGWNIAYGFNESDLQISVLQLNMFLNQYDHVPYDAILYLTAECNYGGRVTDNWDRRLINTILADYVNPIVVADSKYRFAPDERYMLPRKTEHREVLRYVNENFPTLAAPEVYGLHANAGITRDLQTTKTLLESMTAILCCEIHGDATLGNEEENIVVGDVVGTEKSAELLLLPMITQIIDEMPNDMDVDEAKIKYPVDYNESMNVVLVQEMERFLKLQNEIRTTCESLVNAIRGIIVMTPELEKILKSIKFNRIPKKWLKISYASLKTFGSYMRDLFERLNWLHNWHHNGKPKTFWFAGFFFAHAFLTAALQNYARKYKIPIDTLTFDFEVLDVTTVSRQKSVDDVHVACDDDDGVYINGLFLEGARWNWHDKVIDEQLPKILMYEMPAIYLNPMEIIKLVESTRYKCPLYKTTARKGVLSTTGHSTNYVMTMLLNANVPATHWIKRSAALICQTTD